MIITDNMVEMVKAQIKQEKLEDQKTKKRDYQREYMRKYKKDVVLTEDEKLKKKVRRTLGKINKDKLKTIIAELLGENKN
jgi:rRNA-processing protein FCF1